MRKAFSGFDEKIFSLWFGEWYQPLCQFAYTYVADPDAAEDLVQEVFVAVWTRKSEWTDPKNVKSYLFASVRNACLAYLKKKDKDRLAAGWYESLEMEADELEREMERQKLRVRLRLAAGQLPAKCKKVFELVKMEGLSYEEAATYLSLSTKTIEKQIAKSYRLMRKYLEKNSE